MTNERSIVEKISLTDTMVGVANDGIMKAKRISNVVEGLEGYIKFKGICELCIYGKAHRDVSKLPMRKTTRKLERIHIDIWGPAPAPSINGSKYMLTTIPEKHGLTSCIGE